MKDDEQRAAVLAYVTPLYLFSSFDYTHWKSIPGGLVEYKMEIPVGILLPIAKFIEKDAEDLITSFFLAGLRQYVKFVMDEFKVSTDDIFNFLATDKDIQEFLKANADKV
ncbi:MAG: hypothetical protein J7J52_04865 [Deltaproteobacteria bacterium]|nr:hypothetical protein [Deltaproteobacteria bacterium]